MREESVDLPEPDGPTRAVMEPAGMVAVRPFSTGDPSAFSGRAPGVSSEATWASLPVG